MDKQKFQVGDQVRLISNKHGDSRMNPVWGRDQGKTVGTVIDLDGAWPFKVDWGNGNINSYQWGDLTLHNKKEEKAMVVSPCINKGCNKYDSSSSNGFNCKSWNPRPPREALAKCGGYQYEGGLYIVTKAKGIATSLHTTLKPYEKYIGLVALAVVIDHFLLDGKFAHKFKELAEVIVTKIQDGLGKLTDKLTGEWFTDGTDGEDK